MPLAIEDYALIGDCHTAALVGCDGSIDWKVLVVDIGGSHVKCVATDHKTPIKYESGPKLTPVRMVKNVLKITKGWRFSAVSIGYPGVVRRDRIVREPHNLGSGWVSFDFQAAFGHPVKTINDAAMQALGAYEGGKMLFLGLGTGLGSALIVDGVIAAMELGHLPTPIRIGWTLADEGDRRDPAAGEQTA